MAACGRAIRTEFLRVPAADLTVIVIANLATIDPWRLAHAIAADALEGDKRLKPKLEPITEAEIKPIAGTWFNADEPSLFDLAWKNGEAVGDPERHALRAGPPARRLVRRRARLVRVHAEARQGHAARRPRRGPRAQPSRSSASARRCRRRSPAPMSRPNSGARWDITRNGDGWQTASERPADRRAARPGRCAASMPTPIETEMPAGWITATQLAHLVRDRAGSIEAIEVSTGRIKKMRFERHGLSPERTAGVSSRRSDHVVAAARRALASGETTELTGTGSRTAGRRWSTARSGRARA